MRTRTRDGTVIVQTLFKWECPHPPPRLAVVKRQDAGELVEPQPKVWGGGGPVTAAWGSWTPRAILGKETWTGVLEGEGATLDSPNCGTWTRRLEPAPIDLNPSIQQVALPVDLG